jgi:hypothetical protein
LTRHVDKMLVALSRRRFRGTQLHLICASRAFYRAVDFDGFIRTLYSRPLYPRHLESLII